GNSVQMNCFVDADHAGDRLTRRSHTGILIFLNRAPILWYSKKQNTVETSTFGSEFVAMKIATEMIQGLRYKLRMIGIPIEGSTNVFCDNEAVVKNSTAPESTLKKKHNAIAYHRVREAVAANMLRIAKEDTSTNLADLLTKSLPGPRLKQVCERILF
ncbi:MAG: Ty1/Copia family ribonuclease HI, partial [Gloeomargaritales cyanobacterium]